MPNTPNRRPPVRPVRRRRRRKFRPQFLALVYTLLALVILIPLAVHFLGGRKDDAGSGKDSTSSSSVSDSASASDSSLSDSSDSVPSEENSDAESGSDAVSEDPAALELAAGKAAIESIAAQMSALETSVPFSASVTAGHPYLAAVNRAANTVTIYEDDGNGNYYKPYCAMICSTGGENTPRGVWNMPTSDESPARSSGLNGTFWTGTFTVSTSPASPPTMGFSSIRFRITPAVRRTALSTTSSINSVRPQAPAASASRSSMPSGSMITFRPER